MAKSKFANGGGIPVTRQDPANSNIVPKNTVVGASPKEQQIKAATAELAKSAAENKILPSAGAKLHPGQEPSSISPAQAQEMIGPATSATTPSMVESPISPAQAQAMIGPATSATTPSIAASPNRRFAPQGRAGKTRQYAKGGSVSSASSRGDGCAQRGKTKGRIV